MVETSMISTVQDSKDKNKSIESTANSSSEYSEKDKQNEKHKPNKKSSN